MEIPAQLQDAIATLPPEESAELKHILEEFPAGDLEFKALINDNLDSLVQALVNDVESSLMAC